MSDFEALAAAVAAGIAAVGRGKQFAQQASLAFGEATAALAAASAESAIADLPGVTDQARNEADALIGKLEQISDSLTAYLASLGRSVSSESPQVKAPKPQEQDRGRREVHTTSSRSDSPGDPRAEALRSELPSPVQKSGGGQKTHGRWLTSDPDMEAQTIVSGKDEMSDETERYLREQDLAKRGMPSAVYDVEMKLAVHMVKNGITHAAVTINNVPCQGPFSCDRLVPKILPPGSTLDVHGTTADGGKTYKRYGEGGKA